MGSFSTETGAEVQMMSELELVEGQYQRLATEVIYSGFEGQEDPAKRRELEKLGEKLTWLSDPDFSHCATSERQQG
jgi:hypothetical protein